MAELRKFCRNWVFAEGFEQSWTKSLIAQTVPVVLPHTAVELPADYFDEKSYQRQFTYQIHLERHADFDDKEVSLVFDAAMANTHIYGNGKLLGTHPDGYTPFEVRLTDEINHDGLLITVVVDGSENPDIPPFGGQIDYLTYAGIYREVWLRISDPISIDNIKIETPNVLAPNKTVSVNCRLKKPSDLPLSGSGVLLAEIYSPEGELVGKQSTAISDMNIDLSIDDLCDIQLWGLDKPTLYRIKLTLNIGSFSDTYEQWFGFRHAEFEPDGFRLNGEKVKLIGLNRHQSFPYSGYAQGKLSQERDAEILKNELACNIVRTSHYPQSKYFLDHCDRIGLLVLEEFPGWQHLGGEKWQDEAVRNVRRMIERDWNHPSIIMWGVRINESIDNDDFYLRTNELAHQLDSTRQTGGIRKHMHSTMLEDVYTFNDFVLGSHEMPNSNISRTPLRDQQTVTGVSVKVPYMVTEYNGHMYPTKSFDQEQRQMEHVTRHLDILNAAHGDAHIAGCIGWCMFDYNTHKDFGSGDRVCYHGVLTHYREPKFAAYAYASQGKPENNLVLEPVTFWSRGERNIGGTLPLMILTNCEFVRMKLPGGIIKDILPDRKHYPHLPHPPALLRHEDINGDELGKWGQAWSDVEFVGIINGEEVTSRKMVADPVATTLEVVPDRIELDADFEELRFAIRALDQVGNVLPFIDAAVHIRIKGPAILIGPDTPTLRGGTTGFWIRSQGQKGRITVSVSSQRFATQDIQIELT